MLKKNEIFNVKIENLAFPNKGIGKIGEYKIVVKNTLPGQEVSARVTKKKNGIVEGRLCEVIERAPYETEPKCKHFDICGGCAYQTISFEKENQIKEKQVLDLLNNADIKDFAFEGIETSPVIEGYRNKCEFSFGDNGKDGVLSLGMRKRNSFYEVVNLTDCNIIDSDYLLIIKAVVEFFRERNVPFYHKTRHDGILRHLVVRKGAYTGEILINLVTANKIIFSLGEFMDMLLSLKLEGKIVSILHTENNSVADIVQSDKTEIIYGSDFYTDRLFDLEFKITAFSFFQTNTKGAEKLYSIVKDYAGDTSNKTVFDLYCGTGTISQIMAKNSGKVIGIELVEEAVEAARENAARNSISNCEFISGDVLKKVDELNEKPDIIIVDPPREGIHPKAIGKIINFGAEKIIYVSCKPSSLARDIAIFEKNGYKADRLKCVNQFCRTSHCESICLLKKK
ncbi:MAG: 23S rRNA (uracil(1939)-C(5))-methyltransferase RlmD [Clostridia bacterium]|jgi:23S rRNA (uracil-5-)-methyltransferase RumA|nr:23S rRNA (uracil(1939)-C(5))-methyltransferase RlmD [Clostridia bacterium]